MRHRMLPDAPVRWSMMLAMVGVFQLCRPGSALAAVTLTAARTELLYSSSSNVDCSSLFKLDDAALPFYATRLRVNVDNPPPGVPLGFHWSLPKKSSAGIPAADLDLGPSDETSAIDGMCADFGNTCILTGKKLTFYSEPRLLFIAPTCDVLPSNTSRQFHGGVTPIRVKVTAGRRKLGQATARIGWGRNGAVKLFAWNGDLTNSGARVLKDGLGSRNAVGVPLNVVFGATAEAPVPAPGPITAFKFDNHGGASATVGPGCDIGTVPSVDACAEVDYMSMGTFLPTVAAEFDDGSALCDNMTVHVLLCSGDLRLDVTPKPKLAVYDPAKPNRSIVELVVRLTNTSKARGNLPACPFEFRGANVLSCAEALKVGRIKDAKTTQFDLPHCSRTQDQPCSADADCSSVSIQPGLTPPCPDCEAGEVCLTQPHCSETVDVACGNDSDCDNQGPMPACRRCKDDEHCVRVLTNLGSRFDLSPGQSVILLDQSVTLRNVFPDPAKMVDTWTASSALPPFTVNDVVKYGIRGRPQ